MGINRCGTLFLIPRLESAMTTSTRLPDERDARAAFHAVADQRYQQFLDTGVSIPWECVRGYLMERFGSSSGSSPLQASRFRPAGQLPGLPAPERIDQERYSQANRDEVEPTRRHDGKHVLHQVGGEQRR